MKAGEIEHPIQLCHPWLCRGVLFWIVKPHVRVGYITELDLEKARVWTPEWDELNPGGVIYLAHRKVYVLRHDPTEGRYIVAYDGLAVRWWLFKERAKRAAKRLKACVGQAIQLFGGKLMGDCT